MDEHHAPFFFPFPFHICHANPIRHPPFPLQYMGKNEEMYPQLPFTQHLDHAERTTCLCQLQLYFCGQFLSPLRTITSGREQTHHPPHTQESF